MKWFEKIRARREELGLSQAELAKAVDISQAAINKIENGGVAKSRFLPRIARRLQLNLADLDNDFINEASRHIIYPDKIQHIGYKLLADKDISDPDGDTDLLLTSSRPDGYLNVYNDPIGKIKRPPFLSSFNNLTAFMISGSEMFPEFEDGDVVFGTPELEPIAGSSCLFVSNKYRDPLGTFCKFRRVTHVKDGSWATIYWNSRKRDENKEIFTKNDWHVGLRVLAKYYGRLTAWDADLSGWLEE